MKKNAFKGIYNLRYILSGIFFILIFSFLFFNNVVREDLKNLNDQNQSISKTIDLFESFQNATLILISKEKSNFNSDELSKIGLETKIFKEKIINSLSSLINENLKIKNNNNTFINIQNKFEKIILTVNKFDKNNLATTQDIQQIVDEIIILNNELNITKSFLSEFQNERSIEYEIKAKKYQTIEIVLSILCIIGFISAFFKESSLLKKREQKEKEMLAALKDVRNYRYALRESAIMTIADKDGKIIDCNENFAKISQYEKEEVLGKDHRILNSRLHPKSFFKEMWSTVLSGKIWKGEICNKSKNGNFYWVDTRIVPQFDEYGNLDSFISIRYDITEKKNIENKLIIQMERAQEATTLKTQFLANMSHEIRTPLNTVVGIADLLNDENLSEDAQKNIKYLKSAALSVVDLINDILFLSDIENGKFHIIKTNTDYSEFNESLKSIFDLKAKQKNVEFKIEVDEKIPKFILIDALRLKQILLHLIDNAFKFTSSGSILVKTQLLEEDDKNLKLKVSVEDTGTGIHWSKIEKIFESFNQADAGMTRNFSGTGLGLSIVQSLVRLLGSEIIVESEVGKGTHFSFEFFCASGRIEKENISDTSSMQIDKDLKILYVEDNDMNQELFKRIMKKFNLEVDLANNGEIGQEMAITNNYDVVFMDIQMPVMDGWEATRLIREYEKDMGKHTPIFALTANVMPAERKKCFESGIDDILEKPIKKSKLLEALKKVRKKVQAA